MPSTGGSLMKQRAVLWPALSGLQMLWPMEHYRTFCNFYACPVCPAHIYGAEENGFSQKEAVKLSFLLLLFKNN